MCSPPAEQPESLLPCSLPVLDRFLLGSGASHAVRISTISFGAAARGELSPETESLPTQVLSSDPREKFQDESDILQAPVPEADPARTEEIVREEQILREGESLHVPGQQQQPTAGRQMQEGKGSVVSPVG